MEERRACGGGLSCRGEAGSNCEEEAHSKSCEKVEKGNQDQQARQGQVFACEAVLTDEEDS